jgi:acetyltransferase-like isoleucine patch superfamily enzyme
MTIARKVFRKMTYFFRSLRMRLNRSFLFAKTIKIDSGVTLQAGISARVFGKIVAFNNAQIILGDRVAVNSRSMLSTSGGVIELCSGCQIGKDVLLEAGVNGRIMIGRRTTFYGNALLSGNIEVGSDVLFSPNVNILSSSHCIEGRSSIRQLDQDYIKLHGGLPDYPIKIGNECWIGVNSVILPGTELGKGCVVAAGAVVKGVYPDYTVIGGVPGKVLKYR